MITADFTVIATPKVHFWRRYCRFSPLVNGANATFGIPADPTDEASPYCENCAPAAIPDGVIIKDNDILVPRVIAYMPDGRVPRLPKMLFRKQSDGWRGWLVCHNETCLTDPEDVNFPLCWVQQVFEAAIRAARRDGVEVAV